MTAKPQQMAGQPDAADDLIAELAKLMAQDATAERPAEPARPSFSVRIPGDDAPAAPVATHAPAPGFEAARPAPVPTQAPQPAPAAPVAPPRPVAAAPTPEPFNFDFEIQPTNRGPVEPVRAPAPTPAPAAPVSEEPFVPFDHDSIADLIAAELTDEPAPVAEVPLARVQQPASPSASVAAAGLAMGASASRDPAPALHAPVAQPAPRSEPRQTPTSEQDRFKVPPVFGLASRPVPETTPNPTPTYVEPSFGQPQSAPRVALDPAPAAQHDDIGNDPIDEIESLIGRAIRVDLDTPAEPAPAPVAERPAPSPALRSLATPTAPATPPTPPRARPVSSADDAIMAAAHASGAEIGWVDGPDANDAGFAAAAAAHTPRAARRRGIPRALAGPLVALTLFAAAGFGLYWVLGSNGDSGPAPTLTADATPVKQVAEPPTGTTQQSVVFNEIDGVVPGANEQLVSRDQTDVNEVTQIPPTSSTSEEGLANRKVRTVTVRPDGTIVSGEDSVAGSTILPVDRPNVPAVPGASVPSTDLIANIAAETEPTPTAAPAPVAATPASTVTPVTPGSVVQAVDLSGTPIAGKTAPVPMAKPATFRPQAATTLPGSPVNAVVNTAGGNSLPPPPGTSLLGSTPVQSLPTPAQQPAVSQPTEVAALPNNAPAYVQLASQRTEADARASAQAMVSRFGPLFGGANMEVQRVDLGDRGIYYRVRVPAASLSAANTMCNNVKAAGGDCFTM